jgi:lactate dehydrogenase-like 2-hydroxyacid dehydrogenase
MQARVRTAWAALAEATDLRVSEERFPTETALAAAVNDWGAQVLGCHLSHPIPARLQANPTLVAVCTSTAGYNHIQQVPGVLVTHTPNVLHRTVADFTIALVLGSLRNLIDLHGYVWGGHWAAGQKWDLDENLNNTLDNLTLGIVGMGQIGVELVRRLAPWGIDIAYYDIRRQESVEENYPNVRFVADMGDLFAGADIVSLNMPLNEHTHHLVGTSLLKRMRPGALLVNTARGPVLDSQALYDLLEAGDITVHLAFDVYEEEPLPAAELARIQRIKAARPEIRMLLIPHNASADADTRAEMACMILDDLRRIATSSAPGDLEGIRLIPEQRDLRTWEAAAYAGYRISNLWVE